MMTRYISSIAKLTDLRDRDGLEIAFATVLFDLLGPNELVLWRLVEHEGEVHLRQRARINAQTRIAVSDTLTDVRDLPKLKEFRSLLQCHTAKERVCRAHADGSYTYVFPIHKDVANVGLLEIKQGKFLSPHQNRLVAGLLQIYCNYNRVLDAGLYDQLTGLLNRRTYDEHLLMLLEAHRTAPAPTSLPAGDRRADAPNAPSWLAVIDIDHFKRINDVFGHLYGDEVLVLLARLLGTLFRENDRIFRFGGEEFVVVLSKIPDNAVGDVLERCRANVEAFAFPQVGKVTISLGYTAIQAHDSGSSVFGRADKALYLAKQSGRNRVCKYETLLAEGNLNECEEKHGEIDIF